MSTFTFFSALEKLSGLDNDRNNNKKRIVIPDYFLKLLLQNKTRLLKEHFNKKSVKELLINRNIFNKKYNEPKYPNFCLVSQKYKSLQKNIYNSESNKYNNALPKISERKTLFNLRYKEDQRNYEKFQNIGKELINIQSKNNNNIQTESVIVNKSINQLYFLSQKKKTNSNENIKNSNNSSENNNKRLTNLHCQNMTFVGPFSTDMVSRNNSRFNEILNEYLTNHYFKSRKSPKKNSNKNDNNIFININEDSGENKENKDNLSSKFNNNTLYNTITNRDIFEYNYYNNNNINNEIIRKGKEKNINKKLISVMDNSNNSNINPQKKLFFKKSFREQQINLRPLKFFNSFSSSANKINKIQIQSRVTPLNLLSSFKHKYASKEDIQKKISKQILSFPLYINISSNNSKDIYYYFINRMYRNQLVEYMKHRTNWELVTNSNDGQKTINFVWKYMSNRINFKNFKYEPNKPSKKLRMVNLFERNYEVGNKKNMFINLITFCDKANINAFNLVPFTIIINNTKDVDYCLEAIYDIIDFLNNNKVTNKDLITNKKYSEHFWFDKNFENLKNQYINMNKNFLSDKNYWILKPTDLYQGKCIEICNSFEEINKKCRNMFKGVEKKFIPELVIREEESDDELIQNNNSSKIIMEDNNNINNTDNNNAIENKNNINSNNNNKKKITYSKMYCSNEIIIQKYLDRPLLYYKRKFDIRCFVLVDSNLNVFFCREGHLKGSSEFYDLNNTNKIIHITNYSLQKKSSRFEQFEDGNEISYNDFKKYLTEKNIPIDNFNNMITQMKYLVEISFKSVGKKLTKANPVLCFEIFGYDFIIDNDFKPWILEINNNPGLCISSPLIKKLVPRMLDDAFRLTIDKVFETRYDPEVIDSDGKYKTKYKLEGFSDDENIFEFLCNVN